MWTQLTREVNRSSVLTFLIVFVLPTDHICPFVCCNLYWPRNDKSLAEAIMRQAGPSYYCPPRPCWCLVTIQNLIVNRQQPRRLSHVIWIMTLVLSKYHYETFNNDVSVSVIRICCSTQKEYYHSAWDKHKILLQHCEREIIILV